MLTAPYCLENVPVDLLCPVVVGRTHELEVLGRALVEARNGRGLIVLPNTRGIVKIDAANGTALDLSVPLDDVDLWDPAVGIPLASARRRRDRTR